MTRPRSKKLVAILPAIYDLAAGANRFGYRCNGGRPAQQCWGLKAAFGIGSKKAFRSPAVRAADARIEAVLKRPEHLRAAGTTRDDIDAILDALAAVGTAVIPNFIWRPELPDPADEMVLETAVNGRADLIVTFNLSHLKHGARKFGIRAVRPPEAFSILEV